MSLQTLHEMDKVGFRGFLFSESAQGFEPQRLTPGKPLILDFIHLVEDRHEVR